MAAYSWPLSRQTAFDLNGDPVPGALLQFFASGTSTPLVGYSDNGLTTPLPNTIEADASGRWPRIYLPYGDYRERVRTAGGMLLWDDDGIANPNPAAENGAVGPGDDRLFTTGDIKWSLDPGPIYNFVRLNARTIGNDASGATERANDDTLALYTWLWDRLSNSVCPVSTGRGGSAAADFASGKTLGLPDMRGRAPFGTDTMGNTDSGRLNGVTFGFGDGSAPGSNGGTGLETLTAGQIPAHSHTASSNVTDPAHSHGPGSGSSFQNLEPGGTTPDYLGGSSLTTASGATASATTGISVSTTVNPNTGGGGAHNNMPPFMTGTWFIKL